jgi:DNA uptake protein ComE-like DNA-binding protein
VKVTQTTETTVRVSRVSAIDLAGSEDNRRTDNNKERLVESSAINKSLFVLSQCVEAISKKQSRIPYRESKMTRILSLGQNNGMTIMVLNLAPVRSYHLDTLSSLNMANRTKKIEVAEVENEPMFRTMVKPLGTISSVGGANIARQPLRPLTAAHNVNLQQDRDTEKRKPGDKPVKAFSVYSDARKSASRMSNLPSQNQGIRRTETNKRAAESNALGSRPSKTSRLGETASRSNENAMSKASIEALIAQRIDEKLAEKALQDATASAPALSAELQKRLDELEHRIEAKEEDGKAEGLQFLLMAKQHQVRKEEASALRMYQLALPYFPGNEKLKAKMHMLEERIRAKKESESRHILAPLPSASSNTVPPTLALPPPSALMAPLKVEKKQSKQKIVYKDDEEEDEFAPVVVSDHDSSFASDASFLYKPKASRKPKKAAKRLPIFRDDAEPENQSASQPGEQTPRTARLLKIINSRDVHQIKALKGVGAKKADAIVSCLMEMDSDEVHDLESLALLKGVSGKTVENMRMGLGVEIGGF